MKKFGNEQQSKMINKGLNKNKIIHFYRQIIECYKPEIKEFYWGDKNEFNVLIEQADKSNKGNDNIIITCQNEEEIELSKTLFDFLFRGDNRCTFNRPIGQRYVYEDYIFIELIEALTVTIDADMGTSGVFQVTKNGNIESCFYIKSKKHYDYPNDIVPFFVSQMKNRFKTFKDKLPSRFIDHFRSIDYILKVRQNEDNLLIKLLYKLATNLGIIENVVVGHKEISVQQEIQAILDDENKIDLTNEYDENLDSLKFYISAIRNPNCYYRFLDAYHILESFFYKYFYSYVKDLDNNIQKVKFCDKIKKHIQKPQMLKLVIENCLTSSDFQSIKNKLLQIKTQDLARCIGESFNIGEWDTNEAEDFSQKFAALICAFRNAIVHSTESSKYIEQIEKTPSLIFEFVELTNILLEAVKYVLERNIDKW